MNTRRSGTQTSLKSATSLARAEFSPVLHRTAQAAVIRNRVHALLRERETQSVPAPESLSPRTPTLGGRFWDPHLIDRLQTRLTRFRD